MPNWLYLLTNFVYHLGLAIWIGGSIALGALVAPALFRMLPRPQAVAVLHGRVALQRGRVAVRRGRVAVLHGRCGVAARACGVAARVAWKAEDLCCISPPERA